MQTKGCCKGNNYEQRFALDIRFLLIVHDDVRTSEENNKYNLYNILQPSYPLQEKQLQHGPGEAVPFHGTLSRHGIT